MNSKFPYIRVPDSNYVAMFGSLSTLQKIILCGYFVPFNGCRWECSGHAVTFLLNVENKEGNLLRTWKFDICSK